MQVIPFFTVVEKRTLWGERMSRNLSPDPPLLSTRSCKMVSDCRELHPIYKGRLSAEVVALSCTYSLIAPLTAGEVVLRTAGLLYN